MTLALALLAVVPASSQDKKAEGQPLDLEAYLKLAEPGPQHKLLEPLVGTWTYKAKLWMDPSKPPTESTGTCERKWILGNRYLEEHIKGDEKDRPFAGRGLIGYDNGQKKYVTAWVDNMGSGIMTSTGTADSTGKVFTYHSESFDPVMKKMVKGRDVLTIESADRHRMEAYRVLPDGKEMKVLELTVTRAKK
jgi:hypothetical protein